jgi:hypothetical protein
MRVGVDDEPQIAERIPVCFKGSNDVLLFTRTASIDQHGLLTFDQVSIRQAKWNPNNHIGN